MANSVSPFLSKRTPPPKSWLFTMFFAIIFLVGVAAILYPVHFHPELILRALMDRARDSRTRLGPEVIGFRKLLGPEDLIYDATENVIYTGTADGWIKRFTANDSAADTVVQDWVYTGGRPLGVALSKNGELIIADADKGLLKVTSEKKIELLTNESEGLKFKFTNAVDVAEDGIIYFTDTSYKYSLAEFPLDIAEGKPHGRLLSYDPATKKTTTLLSELYFANGVAVSPDQQFVVYCETVLASCSKYYIDGPHKGSKAKFFDGLPGLPDNIHSVGHNQFLIGLVPLPIAPALKFRYPIIGQAAAIIANYIGRPRFENDGGVLAVDLEGKTIKHHFDPYFPKIASAIMVGNYMYCGSLEEPFVLHFDLGQNPALFAA